MKKFKLCLLLSAAFIVLCSAAWVKITLVKPALVPLPVEIQTLAIIDRTLQDKTKGAQIEKVLTVEAFKQDEMAVREVIAGITDRCGEYGKFAFITTNEKFVSNYTKTTFPSLLSWDEVETLCKKHGADALLSIELFDSDFLLTPGISGGINTPVKVRANGIAVINLGIRIYFPASRTVIDEFKINHRIDMATYTGNAYGAVSTLLDKTDAINRTSYESGRMYGERISPSYYTVTREFFNKPKKNQNLRAGVRKSEVADWHGAIESWTKALDDKKKKVRRRAAFNIAVGYEVLGDLEMAKTWASKAYTEYGEKEAKYYYDKLVYRIKEEAVLIRQGE
ncbi:MAG: hypothetical protein JXB34_01935 [Bacteroidales bacterium]|nr:hypothetical protein [Bacteroidales bacterium]